MDEELHMPIQSPSYSIIFSVPDRGTVRLGDSHSSNIVNDQNGTKKPQQYMKVFIHTQISDSVNDFRK